MTALPRSIEPDDAEDLFVELAGLKDSSEARDALRNSLIEAHLPLVRQVARRFASWNLALEEALQIGSLGLVKAVDTFDPSLGHTFPAYAVPKIVGEIRHYLRDSNWIVRVPRRAQELQGAVATARDDLTHDLGRSPTISEIAERIGADPSDVVDAIESFRLRTSRSLDAEDPDRAPDPVLEAATSFEDRGFTSSELLLDLREAMTELSDEERLVISRRFGSDMTQSEIAAELGVSQMQVSRILRRSLDRMRRRMDG